MDLKRKIYETHSLARIRRRLEFLFGEEQRLITASEIVQLRNIEVQRWVAELLDEDRCGVVDKAKQKRVEVALKTIERDAGELSRRMRLVRGERTDLYGELDKRG